MSTCRMASTNGSRLTPDTVDDQDCRDADHGSGGNGSDSGGAQRAVSCQGVPGRSEITAACTGLSRCSEASAVPDYGEPTRLDRILVADHHYLSVGVTAVERRQHASHASRQRLQRLR